MQSAELQGDAPVITPQKGQRGKKHDSNNKKKVESGELFVSSMIFQ